MRDGREQTGKKEILFVGFTDVRHVTGHLIVLQKIEFHSRQTPGSPRTVHGLHCCSPDDCVSLVHFKNKRLTGMWGRKKNRLIKKTKTTSLFDLNLRPPFR